jgi:hypothetical protein
MEENAINGIMTQPWSDWAPKLNDYTGFAVTSGADVVILKTFSPKKW